MLLANRIFATLRKNNTSLIATSRRTLVSAIAAVTLIAMLPAGHALAAKSKSGSDWSLHGRLQIDGAQFSSDNPLYADDVAFRRARIALNGKLTSDLKIKLEYELAGDRPTPKSMWMRYDLTKHGKLTVGHFKQPFSLQNATSSRYNTFMERALPNISSEGYRLGAMGSTYGKYWSASAGVTGGTLTDQFKLTQNGTGYFARGVLNPSTDKHQLWHFGLSVEQRNYGSGDTLRLREKPESDISTERMIDTTTLGDLNVGKRYAAEFAWKRDAFNLQAEYTGLSVSRNAGQDLNFGGWYAQAGWFITGESRRYDRRTGSFKNVKPNSASGAWEVAVRVSEMDLNSADIIGGKESNTGLALNWYASEAVRVSLNYIDASARPNSAGQPDDVSILQARFQYLF